MSILGAINIFTSMHIIMQTYREE